MNELSCLRRKRGCIKHRLTSLGTFLNNVSKTIPVNGQVPKESYDLIQSRLSNTGEICKLFNEIQEQIEEICDDTELNAECEQREAFETSYHEIISKLNRIVLNFDAQFETNEVIANPELPIVNDSNTVVKLPIINLPKFDGDYIGWLEFKATYESLIHNNKQISNVHKLHYLKASLTGAAANILKSLEFTDDNYDVAWDLLCTRFGNNELLIFSHVKGICELKVNQNGGSTAFRNACDEITKHTKCLEMLKTAEEQKDAILIYLVTSKFDKFLAKEWENFNQLQKNNYKTDLEVLKAFFIHKADISEKLEHLSNQHETKVPFKQLNKRCSLLAVSFACYYCKEKHAIYNCTEFLKLTPQDRLEKVKSIGLCINCFKSNHKLRDCRSSGCKTCKAKHNTLLHIFNNNQPANGSDPKQHLEKTNLSHFDNKNTTIVSHTSNSSVQVLLSTTLVDIIGQDGQFHTCRALLDNGSQSNFISETLAKILGIKRTPTNIALVGINAAMSSVNSECEVAIHSKTSTFKTKLNCFVIPCITAKLPTYEFDPNTLNIPKQLNLADPQFNKPQKIDLLIGAPLFWELLLQGSINLGKGRPILRETRLGWIISGLVPMSSRQVHCNFAQVGLDNQLKQFWQLEEASYLPNSQDSNTFCDEYFTKTTERNSDGRFIVKIPFNDKLKDLGNSYYAAKQRLLNLECRFARDKSFHSLYLAFMKEYENLGHMSSSVLASNDSDQFILPHHGVVKNDSTTTRLRVVFDGSHKPNSGVSINEAQHVGPTIQSDLMSIILRFRQHQFVVTADIKQMYRQVLIHSSHTKYQRILWRYDASDEIKMYNLNTVTYGMSSAPYLAIRCLFQLASEHQNKHKEACDVIRRDFYVDDILTGTDDAETLVLICKDIVQILQAGGFELRKFVSNNSFVTKEIANSVDSSDVLLLGSSENTKTLGVYWSVQNDTLFYKEMSSFTERNPITKRTILSITAQIFDPLGLISPIVVVTKLILQKLWALKSDWDEEPPESIVNQWQKLMFEFKHVSTFKFPRCVIVSNATVVELHGFCDASKLAYGACIYARSINISGKIDVHLVCAKSRVAPLKTVTIPRLELCGALILTQLMEKVRSSFTVPTSSFYWTDSQVVIHWINTDKDLLTTFVSTRVHKIQNLSHASEWHYINTKINPADHISRGTTPLQLSRSKMWWHGPSMLQEQNDLEIHLSPCKPLPEVPELKRKVTLTVTESLVDFPFDRFSKLEKLVRTVAYQFRFYKIISKTSVDHGPITPNEYNFALERIAKLVQEQSFADEICTIKTKGSVNNKSNLLGLTPFIDQKGLLRVGGRLNSSDYNADKRNPILLPKNHILSKLILQNMHNKLLHAGVQQSVAASREKFWIISAKVLARQIIKSCLVCFKFKASQSQTMMGNLPKARVTQSLPFQHTGVDYAGPFLINNKRGRGAQKIKCYVVLYVCFATKCIHLEAVTDLTTENFIASLRRFVARRGHPAHIYSDNGKTFVGANNELQRLAVFLQNNSNEICEKSNSLNITWHFIPPYSPHFGGLWEAGVKSMKLHLIKVLANTSLIYEEFVTVLVQVEAILNSRPLCPISTDPNDLLALTPAHFLVGRSLVQVAEPNVIDVSTNKLSRYQYMQQLQQHYWRRWEMEYLHHLQVRTKWKTNQHAIKLGSLVLLKEPAQPPMVWTLGRVIKLHPGADDVVRVVSLRTVKGVIKRATSLLCPLPDIEAEGECV